MKDFFILKIWAKNVVACYPQEHVVHGKTWYLNVES